MVCNPGLLSTANTGFITNPPNFVVIPPFFRSYPESFSHLADLLLEVFYIPDGVYIVFRPFDDVLVCGHDRGMVLAAKGIGNRLERHIDKRAA